MKMKIFGFCLALFLVLNSGLVTAIWSPQDGKEGQSRFTTYDYSFSDIDSNPWNEREFECRLIDLYPTALITNYPEMTTIIIDDDTQILMHNNNISVINVTGGTQAAGKINCALLDTYEMPDDVVQNDIPLGLDVLGNKMVVTSLDTLGEDYRYTVYNLDTGSEVCSTSIQYGYGIPYQLLILEEESVFVTLGDYNTHDGYSSDSISAFDITDCSETWNYPLGYYLDLYGTVSDTTNYLSYDSVNDRVNILSSEDWDCGESSLCSQYVIQSVSSTTGSLVWEYASGEDMHCYLKMGSGILTDPSTGDVYINVWDEKCSATNDPVDFSEIVKIDDTGSMQWRNLNNVSKYHMAYSPYTDNLCFIENETGDLRCLDGQTGDLDYMFDLEQNTATEMCDPLIVYDNVCACNESSVGASWVDVYCFDMNDGVHAETLTMEDDYFIPAKLVQSESLFGFSQYDTGVQKLYTILFNNTYVDVPYDVETTTMGISWSTFDAATGNDVNGNANGDLLVSFVGNVAGSFYDFEMPDGVNDDSTTIMPTGWYDVYAAKYPYYGFKQYKSSMYLCNESSEPACSHVDLYMDIDVGSVDLKVTVREQDSTNFTSGQQVNIINCPDLAVAVTDDQYLEYYQQNPSECRVVDVEDTNASGQVFFDDLWDMDAKQYLIWSSKVYEVNGQDEVVYAYKIVPVIGLPDQHNLHYYIYFDLPERNEYCFEFIDGDSYDAINGVTIKLEDDLGTRLYDGLTTTNYYRFNYTGLINEFYIDATKDDYIPLNNYRLSSSLSDECSDTSVRLYKTAQDQVRYSLSGYVFDNATDIIAGLPLEIECISPDNTRNIIKLNRTTVTGDYIFNGLPKDYTCFITHTSSDYIAKTYSLDMIENTTDYNLTFIPNPDDQAYMSLTVYGQKLPNLGAGQLPTVETVVGADVTFKIFFDDQLIDTQQYSTNQEGKTGVVAPLNSRVKATVSADGFFPNEKYYYLTQWFTQESITLLKEQASACNLFGTVKFYNSTNDTYTLLSNELILYDAETNAQHKVSRSDNSTGYYIFPTICGKNYYIKSKYLNKDYQTESLTMPNDGVHFDYRYDIVYESDEVSYDNKIDELIAWIFNLWDFVKILALFIILALIMIASGTVMRGGER